jgi:site-specific recombinase XerC
MAYLGDHQGDLVGLATLLGHGSVSATQVYTRPTLESLSEKVEASSLNVYGQ